MTKESKPNKGPDAKATAATPTADAVVAPATDVATAPITKLDAELASAEFAPPMPPAAPEEPVRARTETAAMDPNEITGSPPPMPADAAPIVEELTSLPGPREIPAGSPGDPAPAPGRVPRGDSRSLRRGSEFALVYRQQTFVITRTGTVGQRGEWRVVEYPTSASASHAYAKECSRFVSEGFSDYRD